MKPSEKKEENESLLQLFIFVDKFFICRAVNVHRLLQYASFFFSSHHDMSDFTAEPSHTHLEWFLMNY